MDNGQSELDSAVFEKKNKNACFQGGHFVCACGEGVNVWGGFVGVLMRIVNDCMVVIGCGDGCVGGGCVLRGVGGWEWVLGKCI